MRSISSFFGKLALVGMVAAIAVYSIAQTPFKSGMNMQSIDNTFASYVAKHGKSYATKEEYEYRRDLFEKNLQLIMEHNSQNGDSGYRLGPNKFSDMTDYELERYLGAVKPYPTEEGSEFELSELEKPSGDLLAGSVDWTSYMNPVRDQGNCGSCWSFATIATVEGRWSVKRGGQKIELSEQQLVDCSAQNMACNGGWPPKALYFLKVYGAQARDQYPYNAVKGACKFSAQQIVAKVTNIYQISSADAALASGPIPVYVQVTNAFRQYAGGIFNGVCGSAINHAVTAVGYGTENGRTYWIIRNSWGASWGEAGYIRVVAKGNCGVYKDVYATVN